MTEQEKIINVILDSASFSKYAFHKDLAPIFAKSIIEAFPQITKKPVVLSCYSKWGGLLFASQDQTFLTEQERKDFIDSHFVEVEND